MSHNDKSKTTTAGENQGVSLTLTAFQAMWEDFEHKYPRAPIAFVVQPRLVRTIQRALHANINSLSVLAPVAIYDDTHQEEEILAFYDHLSLGCYLNRRECPTAWAYLLVGDRETAQKRLNLYLESAKCSS